MNTKMKYLLYAVASLMLGILLAFFVYLTMFFIILLAFSILFFVIIFIIDKINKTSEWKKFITPILFSFVSLFVSYLVTKILEYDIIKNRNQIIENIYAYRTVHNKFPINLKDFGTASKKYNYSVDSSLNSFEITFRGMYGFPNSFTLKY